MHIEHYRVLRSDGGWKKLSVLINKHEPLTKTKFSEFAAHSVYCIHTQ